jgi:hypothetical protein
MTFSLVKKSLPDRKYPAEESAYSEVYQKQSNKSSMLLRRRNVQIAERCTARDMDNFVVSDAYPSIPAKWLT